ncbi:hypothetical protein [Actinomadura opuntiae]|uniref:hypothetical protein n=1 Tax=Actinomadura sp. OS1-43 TaxID=604315 RepID=UPI00255B1742|nr:hypothetical protein [Actinomadura sp. OS1-43]MDL4814751.1 hypothetical protein [Actinomadura sp. OS1-43]
MALIALAADKGAPGVTTAAVALGAVWPRPVLVAECDQAGGDLVYRLPAAAPGGEGDGGMLNPARGLLSLAATARRGLRPDQVAEHCQRLVGGLDVLVGTTNAEQAQAMTWLWGPLGRAFAGLAPVDVIADCGRLGAGTPLLGLLREADLVVLLTRATLEQVAHLRERVAALSAELRGGPPIGVLVLADPRDFRGSIAEVDRIILGARGRQVPDPAAAPGPPPPDVRVLGGLALDPKGADLLSGRWGGRLDRSLLIRSAREVAGDLTARIAAASPVSPASSPASAGTPEHPGAAAPPPPGDAPAAGAPAAGPRESGPHAVPNGRPAAPPDARPDQVPAGGRHEERGR